MAASPTVEERVAGSLVGLAMGDALAMPVHWFYDSATIRSEYGAITSMRAPAPTHRESMISGMTYDGSIDILHDKARFYDVPARPDATKHATGGDTHGHALSVAPESRTHYHASLRRGQNTATVAIARLAIRYLVAQRGRDAYAPDAYLRALETYATTPPPTANDDDDPGQVRAHNDVYLDIWVRRFFASASRGVPLVHCAANQRESWSIGSLDGVVVAVPVIAAYREDAEAIVVARAWEHATLSHRSVTVAAAIAVLAPLLLGLWRSSGDDPGAFAALLDAAMAKLKPPKITGPEMRRSYQSHRGPGNIPRDEKWRQHMVPDAAWPTLRDLVHSWPADVPLEDVAGWLHGAARFSTACYCEHAMAIVLYLCHRFPDDPRAALRANAELGGHSTARGAILGAILGAKHGLAGLPQDWLADLADPVQVVDREAKALAAMPVVYYEG